MGIHGVPCHSEDFAVALALGEWWPLPELVLDPLGFEGFMGSHLAPSFVYGCLALHVALAALHFLSFLAASHPLRSNCVGVGRW